ncbi:MAG: hypothetical protein ACREPP_04380 [Rhodanobacteraceae bacterium]
MNTRLQGSIALALIGLSTVAVTHKAQACGLPTGLVTAARNWAPPAYMPGTRTSSHPGQRSAIANDLQLRAPITGLYQFTMTAEGNGPGGPPDGTPIDFGYQAWHADGIEVATSGARPPPSGDVCLGVWARTGPRAYELNHYGLSWDNTGTVYVGPANIRENVTLSSNGNSMSGNFNITQYAPDGSTVLGQVQGAYAATRVTVDSN